MVEIFSLPLRYRRGIKGEVGNEEYRRNFFIDSIRPSPHLASGHLLPYGRRIDLMAFARLRDNAPTVIRNFCLTILTKQMD